VKGFHPIYFIVGREYTYKLNDRLTKTIQSLPIAQVDDLADQLLDFMGISDPENWLNGLAD